MPSRVSPSSGPCWLPDPIEYHGEFRSFTLVEPCDAAPGVPCGVSERAKRRLGGRLIHDPLQIGVATMLVEAARCSDSLNS